MALPLGADAAWQLAPSMSPGRFDEALLVLFQLPVTCELSSTLAVSDDDDNSMSELPAPASQVKSGGSSWADAV